jgi:hypothetical protein
VVPPPPALAIASPKPVVPAIHITINTDPKTSLRVIVTIDVTGPLADAPLVFRPQGKVSQHVIAETRANGAHQMTYSVDLEEPTGGPTMPYAESIELEGTGEDFLALPESSDPLPIHLHLRTGGMITDGASSFGLGVDQDFSARPEELRRAYYIAGEIGRASFHAGDGNDFAAWINHTAFDPRWIGAEVAATRGSIDAFVGRDGTSATPLSLLIVPTKRDEPPVIVVPRSRGFLVSVDRRAAWTAPIRILVAQALAQRYLGAYVGVEPHPGFFRDGFSRMLAREVLYDAGMIDANDRAAEMNQLFAAIAFSDDPQRIESATGALAATAFELSLRKRQSSFRSWLRELLHDASTRKIETIPYSEFLGKVGPDFAPVLDAAIGKHAEVVLPADLLGRCWRLEHKKLVPFELGFVTSAGEQLTVQSVVPKSRAEAAGVKVGDIVTKLDYTAGNSQLPVRLTVKRGEKAIPISYSPAGVARPGRIFERQPGIPDDRCSG